MSFFPKSNIPQSAFLALLAEHPSKEASRKQKFWAGIDRKIIVLVRATKTLSEAGLLQKQSCRPYWLANSKKEFAEATVVTSPSCSSSSNIECG